MLNNNVPTVTGIPPFIAHMHKIITVKGCYNDIKAAVRNFKLELRDAVPQVINDKFKESGGINSSILDSWILSLEQRLRV